jgi:predicted permease
MPNLKLAFRTLFKSPFITLVAILSLALGIGANSAIFSLFDQMLLRPLPVPNPDELVNLAAPGPKPGSQSCGQAGSCDEIFSYPMFRDLERVQTSFTGLAAHRGFGASLGYQGTSVGGDGLLVSGSYFPVLGLAPALGRLLTVDDDKTIGGHFVAVLSYDYWRNRFELNPSVLNQTLLINGHAMTIVGVAPRGFTGTTLGEFPDVFVPISMRGLMSPGFNGFDNRRQYWAYVFGRVKPGISREQATVAINGPYRAIINDVEAPLQRGMSEATMARFKVKEITSEPGHRGQSSFDNDARIPLTILLVVTGTVLLIACSNIANLLLVRGAGRSAEMAVRLSIGANRRQLITQLLTEAVMLAAMGAIGGLLVAKWTLDLIASMVTEEEGARMFAFSLSPEMLMFAGAAAILTGLAFGLFPALHSTRPDLAATLKNQAGQPGGAKAARRFRTTLATVQIAMSMALLVPAGLFAKSLFNVSRVELGLKADHMLLFSLAPELNSYDTQRTRQLFERIEDEFAAQPGVSSVAIAMVPVLAGDNWGNSLVVEGFEAGPDTNTNASFNGVGPGFFRTMAIPLMGGREFTRADAAGAPKVAVVNQAFARKFNLGANPVGKRFGLGGPNAKPDIEIVGFVQDAKYSDVKREVPPQYYLPYRQEERLGFGYVYIRTSTPPEQMLSTVPAVMRQLDSNLPVTDVKTMETQIRENVSEDHIVSTLSLAFALLATMLAAIGLYGVLAYTVAQRTREFGLRMALGADGGAVRGLVMKQVAKMAIVGGAIGMAIAIAIGRLAQSILFEMQGYDPLVLTASTLALGLVALGAGFIPALRASRIDPMNALRYE